MLYSRIDFKAELYRGRVWPHSTGIILYDHNNRRIMIELYMCIKVESHDATRINGKEIIRSWQEHTRF